MTPRRRSINIYYAIVFRRIERMIPIKKALIKVLSAVAAALLALTSAAFAVPVSHVLDVPEGYDPHDYQKAVAFLEQSDAYGVKNGTKISPAYIPGDPESWNFSGEAFVWTEVSGVKMLESVNCPSVPGRLAGALDLAGCSALTSVDCSDSSLVSADLSGCAALDSLVIKNNSLESLDVGGCASLRLLNFASNFVGALDVTDCTSLRCLECRWNLIPELDLSACPGLTVLICTDNRMKTLDLSNNPLLGCVRFLRMADAGQQFISCFIATDPEYSDLNEYFISADCYEGCSFFGGWFTEDGRLLSEYTAYVPKPVDGGSFAARFELDGTKPGDADDSGEVDITDALCILRAAMGLAANPNTASFDVNGDGEVTLYDAMLILRRAMGLFSSER